MTKVRLNPFVINLKGKMGNAVFRLCHTGELQLAMAPDMSHVKWSLAQKEHRGKFKEAAAYAKAAIKDPEIRAYYVDLAAKRNKNPRRPFDMALSDYFDGNDLLLEKALHKRRAQTSPAPVVSVDDFCI